MKKLKTSEEMLAKIRGWEGYRDEVYECAGGKLTCGYGHTGRDVKPGMKVKRGQAEKWFNDDVCRVEQRVESLCRQHCVRLSAGEWDALVSLAYNIGIGNLERSTLWRLLSVGADRERVAAEFDRWVYADGRRLKGLVTRRQYEKRWFLARGMSENHVEFTE